MISSEATAVVLSSGRAEKFVGPTSGAQITASGRGEHRCSACCFSVNSMERVGSPKSDTGFSLVRPIGQTSVATLSHFRWTCQGCEEQTLELVELSSSKTVWSGTGKLQVDYNGQPLDGGEYAIKSGELLIPFTIVSEEELHRFMPPSGRSSWPKI